MRSHHTGEDLSFVRDELAMKMDELASVLVSLTLCIIFEVTLRLWMKSVSFACHHGSRDPNRLICM